MRDFCREYVQARMRSRNIPVKSRQPTRQMAQALFDSEAAAFAGAGTFEALPQCFGTAWAGASSAACARCSVQMRCLFRQTFTDGPESGARGPDRRVMGQLYAMMLDGRDSPVPRRTNRTPRRVPEPWGPPTFAKRWLAERERNPLFAQIPVGSVLERVYHGSPICVRVEEGCYEWQGEHYPTLYAVTKAITGERVHRSRVRTERTGHAWSAKRFFFDAIHRVAVMGL